MCLGRFTWQGSTASLRSITADTTRCHDDSQPLCFRHSHLQGKEIHADWIDLGQEMCRVQGAVVVRRPILASNIAPANTLEFVKTFQAYCGIFKSSLFPTRYDTVRAVRV